MNRGRGEKCNLEKYATGSVQPSWFVWDCPEFSIEMSHVPGNHQRVTLPLPVVWRLQGLRRHLLPNGEQYQLVALSLSVARYCDAEGDCAAPEEKNVKNELIYWMHDNQINKAGLMLIRC